KSMNLQRFTVGLERREQRHIAELLQQFKRIDNEGGFKITGEGILHQDNRSGLICCAQLGDVLETRVTNTELLDFLIQPDARQQRAVDHAHLARQKSLHKARLHQRVVQPGYSRQGRDHKLQSADEIVLQRTQVAAVVKFQKFTAEF